MRKFKVVPTSCHCGGHLAWMEETDRGEEMYGCICHNRLPEHDAEIIPGPFLTRSFDWVVELMRNMEYADKRWRRVRDAFRELT